VSPYKLEMFASCGSKRGRQTLRSRWLIVYVANAPPHWRNPCSSSTANLNLLGLREPILYGSTTLDQVISAASAQCKSLSIRLESIRPNYGRVPIDRIYEAGSNIDVVVINPGALVHTSVPLRDGLLAVVIPAVEVHLATYTGVIRSDRITI
jgi:hypothetical protein